MYLAVVDNKITPQWYAKAMKTKGRPAPCGLGKLGIVVCSYRHQHNLNELTVTSCTIEYLLGYSSKGTVDSVPLASVHYLPCEVFSNVCMSERECGGRQQR